MKKIAILVLGAILSFSSSCEKDDICDGSTPTTPHLVIDFYDIGSYNSSTKVLKNVTALKAFGQGGIDTLSFDGVSRILLPLKTMADTTQYQLTINSNDPSLKNQDNLEFDYTRKNELISRACGYKTLFKLNSDSPKLTDAATADGFWIQKITVVTPNIIDENEAHLNIYF